MNLSKSETTNSRAITSWHRICYTRRSANTIDRYAGPSAGGRYIDRINMQTSVALISEPIGAIAGQGSIANGIGATCVVSERYAAHENAPATKAPIAKYLTNLGDLLRRVGCHRTPPTVSRLKVFCRTAPGIQRSRSVAVTSAGLGSRAASPAEHFVFYFYFPASTFKILNFISCPHSASVRFALHFHSLCFCFVSSALR